VEGREDMRREVGSGFPSFSLFCCIFCAMSRDAFEFTPVEADPGCTLSDISVEGWLAVDLRRLFFDAVPCPCRVCTFSADCPVVEVVEAREVELEEGVLVKRFGLASLNNEMTDLWSATGSANLILRRTGGF